MLRAVVVAGAALAAGVAYADDWGELAGISSTLGVNGNRVCVGEATRGDLGCPTYAPSITTGGDVSVTGNVSANKFIGDGSGLTNLSVSGDRITSGTSSVIINSATSTISFTTAGSQRMTIDGSGNVGMGTTVPSSQRPQAH